MSGRNVPPLTCGALGSFLTTEPGLPRARCGSVSRDTQFFTSMGTAWTVMPMLPLVTDTLRFSALAVSGL